MNVRWQPYVLIVLAGVALIGWVLPGGSSPAQFKTNSMTTSCAINNNAVFVSSGFGLYFTPARANYVQIVVHVYVTQDLTGDSFLAVYRTTGTIPSCDGAVTGLQMVRAVIDLSASVETPIQASTTISFYDNSTINLGANKLTVGTTYAYYIAGFNDPSLGSTTTILNRFTASPLSQRTNIQIFEP